MVIKGDGRDRLESAYNILAPKTEAEKEQLNNGRNGEVKIPEEIKDLSAVMVANGATTYAVGDQLGISQQAASRHANGIFNGHYDAERKAKNDKVADSVKADIRDKALSKLMECISVITPSKLADLGPVDASRVATNMAAVVEKMEPKEQTGLNVGQIIIYGPAKRVPSEYEVVDVESTVIS